MKRADKLPTLSDHLSSAEVESIQRIEKLFAAKDATVCVDGDVRYTVRKVVTALHAYDTQPLKSFHMYLVAAYFRNPLSSLCF